LAVPHAPSGTHPLDATVADRSVPRLRIVEGHVAIGEDRDRGDAGMRMHRHAASQTAHVGLEQVEKDERLQAFAEIRWTHEADDRTGAVSSGSMNDFACHLLLSFTPCLWIGAGNIQCSLDSIPENWSRRAQAMTSD